MKNISISEYGYLGCDNIDTKDTKFVSKRDLKQNDFNEIYNFWLEDKDTQKVFTFENRNCLKATSYVGVIETENLSVEILPKIFQSEDIDTHRYIFIEILKPLLRINNIKIDTANVSISKNKNIFEIFISLFINYIDNLIHKGLKSDYIQRENNQYFLKGKIKIHKQIQKNYIHKERFYVEYDEYLQDRIENRLLKSTIELLLKRTNDFDNKRALRQQLFIFDQVEFSTNYDVDLKKINLYRGMEYYHEPLKLAEVFLKNSSFTSVRGKNKVFSLLFKMEKVFENYMEYVLERSKTSLGIKNIKVNGYKGDWLLSNSDCNMINQQPDYLLEMDNGVKIVSDAKWKLFDINKNETKECEKVDISSSDVYQIFSYLNYYHNVKETAYIFVPKTKNIVKPIELNYLTKQNIQSLGKSLIIIPIDLQKMVMEHNHKFEKNIFE